MRLAPHLVSLLVGASALRAPSSFRLDRRRALQTLGAASLLNGVPLSALADATEFELVVQQAALLDGLASAPVRNVIVTGASSGVGLAGAKLLTAAGHQVTLACRTQAKADAAVKACNAFAASSSSAGPTGLADFYSQRRAGGTARGAACDLSSLSSIRSFAKSVSGEKLDTLVLNAGLSLDATDKTRKATEDGFELTVGTNHLGHFALASLLRPTLAKGSSPRLLVTGSGVHDPATEGGKQGGPEKWAALGDLKGFAEQGAQFSMVDGGTFDPDKAYKDSKLCNLLFTAEASRRLAKKNAKATAHAFSPGLIPSPDGFFRYQPKFFAKTFNAIATKAGVAETSEFGGACLSYVATAPLLDQSTNGWWDTDPPGKHQLLCHLPSAEARSIDEQKELWRLSAGLVGLA